MDQTQQETNLSLNSKFSLWEGPHFLELLGGLQTLFMWGKSFPHGAGQLGAEVQRFVFLTLERRIISFYQLALNWIGNSITEDLNIEDNFIKIQVTSL